MNTDRYFGNILRPPLCSDYDLLQLLAAGLLCGLRRCWTVRSGRSAGSGGRRSVGSSGVRRKR